jgi:uncharacterized protein (DUF1778 family)
MSEPENKIERLEIRLSPSDKTSIILQAQSKNLSVSDYVRGTAIPDSKKKTS